MKPAMASEIATHARPETRPPFGRQRPVPLMQRPYRPAPLSRRRRLAGEARRGSHQVPGNRSVEKVAISAARRGVVGHEAVARAGKRATGVDPRGEGQ